MKLICLTTMDCPKNEVFLLKYSDYHAIDTIAEHSKVIADLGFCWFGKIGKKPQDKYLASLFRNGSILLFLYTKYKLIQCVCSGYTYDTPDYGIPDYYIHELFPKDELKPTVYFKLESMRVIELDVLEEYVVKSGGKPILHDLNKSISSFYILIDKSLWVAPMKKQRVAKAPKRTYAVPNSCIYRVDGICTNRRFVSYQFECERPSNCLRQKPIYQPEE